MIGFTLLLAIVNVLFIPHPVMGYFSAFFIFILQVKLSILYYERKPVLIGLLLLGVTAGLIEVFADHFLVNIGGLNYNPFGLFLLNSPIYMPFAWSIIIFQLGYIGWRLTNVLGFTKGITLTSALSFIYIGSYEFLASFGNLWTYETVSYSIGDVPLYILTAEAIMFLTLPIILKTKTKLRNWKSIFLIKGIIFGSIIIATYVFTYHLFLML